MSDVVIKVDRLHVWLAGIVGCILLLYVGVSDTVRFWRYERSFTERQELRDEFAAEARTLRAQIATLQGQVKAISEAIQHDGD